MTYTSRRLSRATLQARNARMQGIMLGFAAASILSLLVTAIIH